jgi:F-type H+-transporting ATPase subunit delta
MAGDLQVGKRYAQAAFAIARDTGTIDQWRSDLADIASVLAESELAPMLADDRLPVSTRQQLVERVLDVQPLALNLARLLIAKGRSLDAGAVAYQFGRMADAEAGIEHAEITTAIDLTADQVRRIEERLSQASGKQVRATASVDPSILGGVIVRVGDRLVDGSVRTRLKQLRRELEGVR